MYKKGQKYLILFILIGVGIPAFYFTWKVSFAYLAPEMYAGDRKESRDCRMCDGTGTDFDLAESYPELGNRCQFCKGKGRVEVIIPGPNRPTRVWGAVMDASASDDPDLDAPRLRRIPNPLIPEANRTFRGAIAEADIVFRSGSGEQIAFQSDGTGRFSHRIPPGAYTVAISAPGFAPMTRAIVIQPLIEPIWMEKATLLKPPDSPEEAQSLYGLNLLVGLPRNDDEGFFKFEPGSPHT